MADASANWLRRRIRATVTLDSRLEALRRQPKEELVALLAELAATNSEAEARLPRHALAALASRFEADLDKALHAHGAAERHDHAVYKAAAAIGLIADALRGPDLSTRTTLRYSPNPNHLQKEHFAERYVRFGRPRDALAWLDGEETSKVGTMIDSCHLRRPWRRRGGCSARSSATGRSSSRS